MDTDSFPAWMCVFLLALNGIISSPQAGSFCPDRCDCQHPQHIMCTNRGLRTVPEPGAQVSEEVLIFSLGGNFIANVSSVDFLRYNNLVRLNLQYNQIQNIQPKAFVNLSNLEELYLGHNLLSDITTGTLDTLKKLTILYGNNNNIKRIAPGLFSHLENLVKLRLDGNAIQVLQDSVFKSLAGLHYLHLESNNLHHIHRNAFSGLTSLRFLNLAHNKQSAVRNARTFSHLAALTTLLMSENEIRHVGGSVFQSLQKLSRLSLSNNRISRLDRAALKGLSSLRELLIDGNELERIPAGLLDPLERVEELDFSRNHISNVDSLAFSQLKHLKVLKLENNMLSSLSGDIFALNNVLYDLDLHGNNWTCDCRLEDLKRWMTAAHSQGKFLTAFLQCQHPEGLRGKYLDYVNSSELQRLEKLPYLCGGQIGLGESRGGGALVKPEGEKIETGDAIKQEETGEVGETEGEDLHQGESGGPINGRERERWKSEGVIEKVGVRGDEGGVGVAAASASLERKKPKKVPLKPTEEAVFTRARERQRQNVIPRTDPPPLFTSQASEQRENATETLSTAAPGQTGEKYDLLMLHQEEPSPVITDPCVFNHYFLTNVSVDHVTSHTVTVHWTAKEHRRYAPGPGPGPGPGLDEVHYRIMYDRFGSPERFPRYVYARGAARAVTLRELTPEVTYMICVEGVVGRWVCQVAPRDHCVGLVTLPAGFSPGWALTSDLQLLTLATLAGNITLLLVIGGIWLGRRLKRRSQRRKSAAHVRHMYSARRPFRPALATSTDFASYQSSRGARLAPHAEGDLIEFPCDRFLDNNSVRRDSEMQRFAD